MAINKNHLFDELDGTKCAIVESGISAERTMFLRTLLQYNGYTVVVVESPPPKAAPAPKVVVAEGEEATAPTPPVPSAPVTYIVGVTDITFNSTNAVFGRLLHTPDGHVVTLNYWLQKDAVSHDEVPYYERK